MQQPYIQRLLDKACAMQQPVSGTFELTARCNLDCRMCYIHKRANDRLAMLLEKNTAWWVDLARQCQRSGMLTLLITGGEPLLRPDFEEIYRECKKLGLLISINTNAVLLDERLLALFAEEQPYRVNVSFYGASEETYHRLCGVSGVYDRVREAVLELKRRGVHLRLNYTIASHNIDDAAAIHAFAAAHDIPVQATSYLFPPLRACAFGPCENERPDAETAAEYQYRYERISLSEESLQKKRETAGKLLSQTVPLQSPARCRAGISAFWVNCTGQLYACGMIPSVCCELSSMPFSTAWEELKQKSSVIRLPAHCTSCAYRPQCEVCSAICYAENGHFDAPPEYLCRKTAAHLRFLCEGAGEA